MAVMPKRTVDLANAFHWLPAQGDIPALVTVLPDAAELDMPVHDWKLWFSDAAGLIFEVVPPGAPVVFAQTDRLWQGQWVDKTTLIESARRIDAGFREGRGRHRLTWHKIALRRTVGATDLHRPTYSHILAYGGRPGRRTPDVMLGGPKLWRDGIGRDAATLIMTWLAEQGVTEVFNPFCGQGTLLAAANSMGIDSYGCDLDEERVAIAKVTATSDQTNRTNEDDNE